MRAPFRTSTLFSCFMLSCSASPKPSPTHTTTELRAPLPAQVPSSISPPPPRQVENALVAPPTDTANTEPPSEGSAHEQTINTATDGLVGEEPDPQSEVVLKRGFGPDEGDTREFGMVNLTAAGSAVGTSHSSLKVRFDPTTIGGGLDVNVVARILRQGMGTYRDCYQNVVLQAPKAKGKVTLRFQIDDKGSVSHAKALESGFSDPGMIPCLVSAVTALAFPRPSKPPVTVTLPFRFAR